MDTAEQMAIAADWIREADGILITAGAGMGVDSGLPDFRGDHGFWTAYPALKADGINFYDIANGAAFLRDPVRAWGFYGHRLDLYRRTVPHAGFEILHRWAARKRNGGFVFTSNVDGQFQKAGFADDHLFECHGSIHFLQCGRSCTDRIWSADDFQPEVDLNRCALLSPLPTCPNCGGVARPAILMFDDWHWVETRTRRQRMRYEAWLSSVGQIVVIELGAGGAIPTVRSMSERFGPHVVRINPRDYAIDPGKGLGLARGALDVLCSLNESVG
ncbi:MAG TPA: Sir2 family NAD-dependent protein deacetylase [Paraburkholderia sp.]|nr:Sir2 family NAD-dependent protein deacetylase [Paraburkholderia sp.]